MKKSVFTREDYKSERGTFTITVETTKPKFKKGLELMSSMNDVKIMLRSQAVGGFELKDEMEMAELMMLLSEFSDEWHNRNKT